MNNFLQRVLKKHNNEELNAENKSGKEVAGGQKRYGAVRSGPSKENWIKRLGNYSPSKLQVPSSPVGTNTMKAVDKSGPGDTYDAATPRKTSGSPQTSLEMPDLESIIREFEMGYLSPSKQDGVPDGLVKKNFVKKIVAAFEVKYNAYSDQKAALEAQVNQERNKLDQAEAPRVRSCIFGGSPFKSSSKDSTIYKKSDGFSPSKQFHEDASEKPGSPSPLKSNSDTSRRRSGIFSSPFKKIFQDEEKEEEEGLESDKNAKAAEDETKTEKRRSGVIFSENSKDNRKSGIFSSPFSRRGSKDTSASSDIYSSPIKLERQDSKDSSSDCSSLFKFDKEESLRRCNLPFSPSKMSSLDDTKAMEDVDLDVTLPEPEETIFLSGATLPKSSTMINEFSKDTSEDNSESEKVSGADRIPKIVGAFLKKPIEVEDTSIDWIPITGKKLPRKRSLKKLLYSLTGKKLERKSKLFSSERNLSEEPRELQDSGYDEKSCSSSSLNSLISITEVLLQQENSYVEPDRRTTTLKTFKSKNSFDEEEDEAFSDASSRSASKQHKKQLFLTEVPRENLKLDLGPCYPPSKIVTMSLDRKTVPKKACCPSPVYQDLAKLPKHPNLSKIPKHPFVALTKMEEAQELPSGSQSTQESRSSQSSLIIIKGDSSVIVKNDWYEVEFSRSCDDLGSSVTSDYDVPRRFLSKSESEIPSLFQSMATKAKEQPVYDVPKPQASDRPKSSVYEDALSLKRRSIFLANQNGGGNFYAIPRSLKVHCATVKPRNTKIYLSNQAPKSLDDLTSLQKSTTF